MKISQLTDKTVPVEVEWDGERVTFQVLANALTPEFARKMQEASEIDKKEAEAEAKPGETAKKSNASIELFLTKVKSSDLTDDKGKPLDLTVEMFETLIPVPFTEKLLQKITEVWMGKKSIAEKSAGSSEL